MDPYKGFLGASQIAGLRQTIRQGLQTAADVFDTQVQFRQINPANGRFEDVGPVVQLISISFGLREVRSTRGTPVMQRSSDGDIKLWADGFIPQVGNRFSHEGSTVEVTAVYPPEFDHVVAEVKLSQ
jgi:hypothetical protein